jgi:hypothetical protein
MMPAGRDLLSLATRGAPSSIVEDVANRESDAGRVGVVHDSVAADIGPCA